MPKQHFASEGVADNQEFNMALDAAGVKALHAEVEKWQARVPKLATALRARTDDLARARDEIRQLKWALDTSHDDERTDLSLKTRDELIAELDDKSKALAEKVRSLSGKVHSLELALQESQQEGESWKSKWRNVTSSLDQLSADNTQLRGQHAAEIEALCHERDALHAEVEQAGALVKQQERLSDEVQSLRKRNEHLSETTEMANVQMATLGDELTALVKRSEKAEGVRRDLEAELDRTLSVLETAQSDQERRQEKHTAEVADLEQRHADALAQNQRLIADKEEALQKAEKERVEQAKLLASQEERTRQAAVSHRANVARINEELAAAKQEAEGLQARMSAQKGEFEQHKLRHEETLAQMRATEDSERRAKQAIIDALNAELNEERGRSEQADALRTEVAELESQLADQATVQANVENERDRVADKLAETAQALSAVKLSLDQKSQEAIGYEGRLEELEGVLESHAAQTEALTHALDEERARSEQADALRTEVAELESQLADQATVQANVENERDRVADKLAETAQALSAVKLSLEQKSQEAMRYEGRLEELEGVLESHTAQIEALTQALDEERARSEQADALRTEVAQLESRLVDQAGLQAEFEVEKDRLVEKVSGLTEELDAAGQTLAQNAVETERYESQIEKLAETLDARTALVQDLEEERNERLRSNANAQADTDRLQQELNAANQRAETLQTHAAGIEKRLEDQRDFMEQLEKELSEKHTQFVEQQRRAAAECKLREDLQKQIAQGDSRQVAAHQAESFEAQIRELEASVVEREGEREKLSARILDLEEQARVMQAEHITLKAESVDAAEVQALRKQVREFENKFRDRTRELNELRWRQDQEAADLSDDKMVLVLSQQLKDARAELERLQAKATTKPLDESDLTRISGVGEKIAKQLNALGIESIVQLADIDKNDLEDKDHLLHDYRGRVFRDGWIEQARKLIDN